MEMEQKPITLQKFQPMKKLILFVFILISGISNAQIWRFTHSSGTYTPLPANLPSLVSPGWDDEYIPISLPFNFTLRTITSNQWILDTWGLIIDDSTSETAAIIPFSCDVQDRGNLSGTTGVSPIRMQTSGTTPNQIVKIEFVNAGFYNGDSTEFVNFQVWIYENNTVEYRFGPNSYLTGTNAFDGSTGPIIGIANDLTNGLDELYLLDSIAASPVMVFLQNAASPVELDDAPANGKIYRFEKTTPANSLSSNEQKTKIYPNPANDFLYISDVQRGDFISLLNMDGQIVWSAQAQQPKVEIPISELPQGLYLLSTNNKWNYRVEKIMIQH
jgi:Secretion system C-terminal sorting domain